MKKTILFAIVALVLVACGSENRTFKVEGKLTNLDQGEFYVYSIDGGTSQIDTIKVTDGKFAYSIRCNSPATLVVVFPNFSEQPVFAQPGKKVKIKGDASHLKELKITGTKDNELMNGFKVHAAELGPIEAEDYAEQFVNDNPKSAAAVYVVSKYFIQNSHPDYPRALSMVETLSQQQPDNGYLKQLAVWLAPLAATSTGKTMPSFKAKDTAGNDINTATFRNAEVAIISTWAAWDYESVSLQRKLKQLKRKYGQRLQLMSISLDGSLTECKKIVDRDSLKWTTVCDEKMFESPVAKQLAMTRTGDNIVMRRGKIVARGLNVNNIEEKTKGFFAN